MPYRHVRSSKNDSARLSVAGRPLPCSAIAFRPSLREGGSRFLDPPADLERGEYLVLFLVLKSDSVCLLREGERERGTAMKNDSKVELRANGHTSIVKAMVSRQKEAQTQHIQTKINKLFLRRASILHLGAPAPAPAPAPARAPVPAAGTAASCASPSTCPGWG